MFPKTDTVDARENLEDPEWKFQSQCVAVTARHGDAELHACNLRTRSNLGNIG